MRKRCKLSSQGVFSALIAGLFASILYQKFERLFKKSNKDSSFFIEGADSLFNASMQVLMPYLCVVVIFAVFTYLITMIFDVSGIQELFTSSFTLLFSKMQRSYASGFLFIHLRASSSA